MLNNFFKINLPYGISKDENGDWMAFNREHMPLGFNDVWYKEHIGYSYTNIPVHTKYKPLTESFLISIATGEEGLLKNESGEIVQVFLYDEATDPVSNPTDELWEHYFKKLQKLSGMEKLNLQLR